MPETSDNTYTINCDVCGDSFPKTDEHTVPWANLSACSRACKQAWMNYQQVHL